MKSPQTENGFTKIANELLEAMCKVNMNAYQQRVFLAILRKTYGWRKKEDHIAISQIVELTGLKKFHVSRAKAELIARRMVTQRGNYLAVNKDWSAWQRLPNGVTPYRVTQPGDKKVTQPGEHKRKERKKICAQKIELPNGVTTTFQNFYEAYPIHKGKEDALRAWLKATKKQEAEELLIITLGAIKNQKEEKRYLKSVNKFTPEWPMPATWLNKKRWNDEVTREKRWDEA